MLSNLKKFIIPYLYVGPAYLYMAFFLLLPTLLAIKLSFTYIEYSTGNAIFPSIKTWQEVVDPNNITFNFWGAVKLTSFYAITTITLETLLGLIIALVLSNSFRGRGLLRSIVILPMGIPILVAAAASVVMTSEFGILNGILWDTLNIVDKPIPFQKGTFPIIFIEVWKLTPYAVLVILAGLEAIPTSLYEAAKTMGASSLQQFFRITLPLAWPSILVAFALRLAEVFKMFAFPYLVGRTSFNRDVLSVLSREAYNNAIMQGYPQTHSSAYGISIVLLGITFMMVLGGMYLSYKLVRKKIG